MRTATIRSVAGFFEGGYYLRAATIRSAAFIRGRLLFEGGYYSKCGVYSRKHGIYSLANFPFLVLQIPLLLKYIYFREFHERINNDKILAH